MGNRRPILFFLFGILLSLALLVLLGRWNRFFSTADTRRVNLVERPLDGVDHLTIEREGFRIGLISQAGRWVMTAPFSATVDQSVVLAFLDTLESTRILDVTTLGELRKRGLSPADLGLAPPYATLLLEGEGRRSSYRFGSLSPSGSDLYVQIGESDKVFAVPPALLDAMPKNGDDVRSRRLLNEDISQVTKMDIRIPGKPFISLEKRKGGWYLSQPSSVLASSPCVAAMLETLSDARVDSFIWPTVSNVLDVVQSETTMNTRRTLWGLDPDRAICVRVKVGEGEVPYQWLFGGTDESRPALSYLLFNGSETVGLVSNNVVEAFRSDLALLKDTRLFTGRAEDLRGLRVAFGKSVFSFIQTNGVWSLQAPIVTPVDQNLFNEAVNKLLSLHTEPVDPLEHFYREGSIRSKIEFRNMEGKVKRFSVGDSQSDRSLFQIRLDEQQALYAVSSSNFPSVFMDERGIYELHDRTVLMLSPASLLGITCRKSGKVFYRITRSKGDRPWSFPDNSQIDSGRLDRLTALLSALKASRIVKFGISLQDVESHGFREPFAEITLDIDAADALRKNLLIGNRANRDGSRYLLLRGLNILFILDPSSIGILTASPGAR